MKRTRKQNRLCNRSLAGVVAAAIGLFACAAPTDDGTAGTGYAGTLAPAGMGGLPTGGSGASGGAMPCEVETVVKARCQNCHGAALIGGAPMRLVTVDDFQRDYTIQTTPGLIGQTMKTHQIAKIRINRENGTGPMPQGAPLLADQITMLTNWLVSGAPAGAACVAQSPVGGAAGMEVVQPTAGTGAPAGAGGVAGTEVAGAGGFAGTEVVPTDGYRAVNRCIGDAAAEALQPLVEREGETCYEFPVHNVSGATDTSKFSVPTGESYNQFYYEVPWPAGSVATRFGTRFDNLQVLHHWLGFTSTSANAHGTVAKNVTGTTLGENAELVGGWAVGGCNTELPADVGLVMPSTGRIMIQWHHYNFTNTAQPDGSAVQWCTVPASMRAHTAGITFLGTENFNGLAGMPAGQTSDFTTSCTNDSQEPITVITFSPHMHLLGVNTKSVINRVGGMTDDVFDEPFVFDQQVNYDMDPFIVMQPGDKITTTCTFNNTTNANVAFGQSTTQEMCYQFAIAYPHGALNNGVFSLIGATNTCW